MKMRCLNQVSVRASVAARLGGVAIAASMQAVAAEETEEVAELEEVTVTGSRILRRDYEANSPLVTVDSAALEQKSGLNVESYLNQLPAYNPAGSPNVKGGTGGNSDVQISAVNSVGISSVSLRGFGPNRSLVLVDGRRATPNNALMVVDINSIPSSMIKRVEIISGGASATYGADAIGGVSNFILRRDFQGLEVDAQWGTTEAGDGDEMRASAILGTAFAEGRGNLVLSSEYYDRRASWEKNRSFFTRGWADPTTSGNAASLFGMNGYNTLVGNAPNNATLGAILSGRPAGTGVYTSAAGASLGNNALLRFNPDGTIYDPVGNNAWSFGLPIDYQRYSLQNTYDTSNGPGVCNSVNVTLCPNGPKQIQTVKYYETEGYVNSPQTRYAFMASGQYELSDRLTFNTSARFSQSTTATLLTNSTGGQGWGTLIPYNPVTDSPIVPQGTVVNGTAVDYKNAATVAAVLANPGAYANPGFIAHGTTGAQHPVPLQMALLLNSRPNPGAVWDAETYTFTSFPRRSTENTNEAWQIDFGLNYKLPFADWTSEIYYSRGESSTYNVAQGNRSLARYRSLISAADYGYHSALQSNVTHNLPTPSVGFASVPAYCTSGFYETLFNADAPPTDDCTYAVNAPLQTRSQNQQDIGELNLQGGLFELPAGQIRAAAGYQFRRNASQYNPDILQSTASFTDQVIGVYPTGYMDAHTRAEDIYAEFLVPVLQDFGIKKLELELGGRHSSYDQTDSTWTYKINANIEVNDYVRLRGGYNRATRAPNLGEMFLPLQEVFGGAGIYGDPCGLLSNAPFGAAGAAPNPNPSVGGPSVLASGQTQAGATSAYLICRAQMGAAANTFYTANQVAGGGTAPGGTYTYQVGNANLKSEEADTWTAGIVFQSPFQNELLRRLTATVDWYKIDIKDVITLYNLDYARYLCYGTVQVADATAAAAQAAPRNTTDGTSLTTQVSYDNLGTVTTSGVDFTINWNAQLADMGLASIPGGIGLSVQGTWLDYYKTKASPFSYDPVIDWKGSLGPNLPGFNAGAPSYRLLTSLSYNLPSLGFSLRWRHLPSMVTAAKGQENGVIDNNARVAAGGEGMTLSYTPGVSLPIASYDVFDLSGFWTINDTLSVRFGIDNVFDKDPAITGATSGRPYDPNLTAAENAANLQVCNGAPGCQNPNSYSLGSSGLASTSGGYYDSLGRRYYIGVKARF
jgi:outer membrane receptor protein involved in Fe transport